MFSQSDKVLDVIGEGTFGKVFSCWDRDLRKRVACKVVRAIEKYRDAAMIEIEILEKLHKYQENGREYVVPFTYKLLIAILFVLVPLTNQYLR